MKEELELTEVIMRLFSRIEQMERRVEYLMHEDQRPKETHFVSVDQLDQLTTKVEQNMTRKLKQRMEEKEQHS